MDFPLAPKVEKIDHICSWEHCTITKPYVFSPPYNRKSSKETGFEVMEGLRFLASLPLCGTGRRERGEKNETFLSFLAPSR